MEKVRIWASVMCLSSVIGAFVIFLVPEGSVKKSVRIAVSVFLLLSLTVPLADADIFSSIEIPALERSDSLEEYSFTVDAYILNSGKQVVEQSIADCLDRICTQAYTTEIELHVNKQGAIELDAVQITLSGEDAEKKDAIKSEIGSLTGILPEVTVSS